MELDDWMPDGARIDEGGIVLVDTVEQAKHVARHGPKEALVQITDPDEEQKFMKWVLLGAET